MRNFTRSTKIAVMLVTVAAMSGCASLGMAGFREPIVSFKDVKVRGLGLSGGSLDAYLSIYNPNGFRLDATRLTYNVLVGQNQLGTGALNSRFTVQNGDSTTVRIPIDFTYAGIGSAAQCRAYVAAYRDANRIRSGDARGRCRRRRSAHTQT